MAEKTREEKRAFLKNLYRWFDANRASIIAGHEGERVLLSDNAVRGYYADIASALAAANKTGLQFGEFLIQECVTHEAEVDKHRYYGNIRFA